MEKSRAIEVLKPLVNSYVDYANITMKEEDDNIVDALEMAIEALKAQLPTRSADTISRQEAIDALDCISGVEEVLRSLLTIQPEPTDEQVAEYCKRRCLHIVTDDFFHTAQPEPQWIPVSERLPEEPGYYITSNEYNGVGEDFYYDGHFWNADKNAYSVIAWMPKPKPFEGGIK